MSISNNTQKLQSLMDKINALPEAENLDEEISTQETLISEQDAKIAELAEILAGKASVSYPVLSNPATSENLQEGYQLIDGNGNIIIGTHVCSEGSEIVDTCTITIERITSIGPIPIGYTKYENGILEATTGSISGIDTSITINNVLCNSLMTVISNCSSFICTGTGKIISNSIGYSENKYHFLQTPSVTGEHCTFIESSSSDTCCFVAGTQVMTSLDGESTPIEIIKNGDSVVSYNIETGENYMATVKRTIVKSDVTDIAEIYFTNGTTLIMNAYHPIYTQNGWRSITNHKGYETLVIGDIAKTSDG